MSLVLILFGVCLLSLGSAFITISMEEKDNFWLSLIGVILLIGGLLMVGCSATVLYKQAEKEPPQKTYYYEDFKVDPESIDLHNFVIIYDIDKDAYILTKKEEE